MFGFLAPVKGLTVLALAVFLVSILAEAAAVYALKLPINMVQALGQSAVNAAGEAATDGQGGFFAEFWHWFTAASGAGADLRRALLLVIAVQAVRSFLVWARSVVFSWQTMAVIYHMRAGAYDKFQRAGFAFHDRYSSSELINRALSDQKNIRQFLVIGLRAAIDVVLTAGAYLGMLWLCSPRMALAALLPIPFWLWGLRVYARRSQPIYEAERDASDAVVRIVTENIAGAHVVRSFAAEEHELRKFGTAHENLFARVVAAVKVQQCMLPLLRGIVTLAHVGLFTLGAVWVQGGILQLGDLVIFGVAMNAILAKLQQIGTIAENYQKAIVSTRRLVEVLDHPSTTPEAPGAPRLGKGPGQIRARGLRFGYVDGQDVLRGIDLDIPGGSLVAIVGPTGAGKSTLASLIGRCYDPRHGTLEIDGQDVRTVSLASVRHAVGYVFQESYLFSDTIAHNIAFGDPSAPATDIRRAAYVACANEFIDRLPDGEETWLGEAGVGLSGGQRQRLGLARAVLHDPRVLILDDALSAVDAATEARILSRLEPIRAGRTIVMITSRASAAAKADRILVLEDGRVTQQGTHAQLVAQEGYYRRVTMKQWEAGSDSNAEFGMRNAESSGVALAPRDASSGDGEVGSWGPSEAESVDSRSSHPCSERATHPHDDEFSYSHKLDRKQLAHLGRAMWPYRRMYAAALVCTLVMAACELTAPRLARMIVDDGIPSGMWSMLAWLGVAWAGVMLTCLLVERFQIGLSQRAGEGVIRDLRQAIFARLQRLSMSFFDRHKLGQIITRPTSDLDAVRDTVVGGLNTLTANLLLSFGAGCMIYVTDPVLFAAVAWLIPILFFINAHFRKILGVQHQLVRAGFSRLTGNLAENISGIRVVEAFDRQEHNLGRFNALQQENTRNNNRAAHTNGVYGPLLEAIRLTGQLILVGYGAGQVLAGRLTAGQVVAAFFYWDLFMRPAITLGTFYNTLMATLASGERIFALLETESDVRESPNARPLPPLERAIELDHVTFGYDAERPVLHDVSLTIPAGRTIALVGATGSGKTTILALLTRMYDCQAGQVRLDGADVRDATLASLRRQMGVVLQTNFLFSGSILENIRYARPEASDDEVLAAARSLGIHELFLRQTSGYQTEVGERGSAISLGLRQLICFARVLLADSPVFLLDEATSSVDTATEEIIRRAMARVARRRTTVIVAHRLSTVTDADQIVVLDGGRIVEVGKHVELVFRRGSYAKLYRQFLAAAG